VDEAIDVTESMAILAIPVEGGGCWMTLDIMENSDSIVEAVRAVYIEEGNDTPPRGCRVALRT
jgi:hypothetical protein